MNERIRELIEQAGFETDRGPLIVPGPYIKVGGLCVGVPLEKFARLIVRECVTRLEQHHPFTKDPEAYLYAISLIEEHFGVES
jgi:hypothetical protein